MTDKTRSTWWALRIAFGVVPLVAGIDKFFNLLTNWEAYLSPWMANLLPVSPTSFMHVVGVIEMVAGSLVLTRATTRVGAYLVCAWLVCIALNLLTAGHFLDVAVRDLTMAVGAFALGQLTEVEDQVAKRVGRREFGHPVHHPA